MVQAAHLLNQEQALAKDHNVVAARTIRPVIVGAHAMDLFTVRAQDLLGVQTLDAITALGQIRTQDMVVTKVRATQDQNIGQDHHQVLIQEAQDRITVEVLHPSQDQAPT